MAIVLEGFDNSGKSTLAGALPFPTIHPGPRPTTQSEEAICMTRQLAQANQRVTMDRVTSISTPCYTGEPTRNHLLYAKEMTRTTHCVIVYCRPPLQVIQNFARHVAKSYDDAQKIQWLFDNSADVVARYDEYMRRLPHLRYDYTNPDRSVIDAAIEAQHSVKGWQAWLTKAEAART